MARKSVFEVARATTAVLALLTFSTAAHAQIGSGWTAYSPGMNLQLRGCGAHSASGGVETFRLTCSSTSADNRAEQRITNDYSSGTNQFEGEVRVVSLGGMNVSLKQTFMPQNGAFLMIAVGSGGRLYSVGNSGDLATGIVGNWVRLNTIHTYSNGNHQIYINGSIKYTKTGGRQVPWHDKYGSYRLGSGRGPITVEWRNVRFWRGGTSGGGGNTPTPTPTPTNPVATPTPTPTNPPVVTPTPTPTPNGPFSGYYRIQPRHSGKDLVVAGASAADGAAIQQSTYGGSDTREFEWELVAVGSGYYRIVNRNSGKVAAVQGASTGASIPVVQMTYTSGSPTNDEWRVDTLAGGFYGFINRNSGRAMDVKAGSTADGAVIQQSTPSGVNQQQFSIVSVP
jgi:hypothetical protein